MPPVDDSDPGFVRGQIPNAAQWNNYFATKVDTVNGDLASPTISGGKSTDLPTSPDGLPAGTWWDNGGLLCRAL